MENVRELGEDVRELAARAQAHDGVAPLNEEAWLALESGGQGEARHFAHREEGRLLGYLQWEPGAGTGQLVVDPEARRRGIGTSLVGELRESVSRPSWVQLWAFGDLAAARGFAVARGMVPVRELWMMELSRLAGESHGDGSFDLVSLNSHVERAGQTNRPQSCSPITIRSFQEGDIPALLEANAAAFAHHPEQGALDRAGLEARMAEPWFDPEGLLLAVDADGLAGFHWTKRRDATTGEVYVLGVAPRAQGHGLGRVLLDAGLAYLARSGCAKIVLYVDSGDVVAVTMYETAGFTVAHRDVLYASRNTSRKEHR